MQGTQQFNPQVVYVQQREVAAGMRERRVCLWHEVDMVMQAGPGAVIVTGSETWPLSPGMLASRAPGDAVDITGPCTMTVIGFDPVYDPSLEVLYAWGEQCLTQPALAQPREAGHPRERAPDVFPFLETMRGIVPAEQAGYLEALFAACVRLYGKPDTALMLKANLMYVAALLTQATRARKRRMDAGDAVADTRAYMDLNFGLRLTLAGLSKRVFMGREHLCRLFKQRTGETPIAYLTRVRVIYARRLLQGDDPPELIARRCGFTSVNYFYRVFRKHTGMTPAAYRRAAGAETPRAH